MSLDNLELRSGLITSSGDRSGADCSFEIRCFVSLLVESDALGRLLSFSCRIEVVTLLGLVDEDDGAGSEAGVENIA